MTAGEGLGRIGFVLHRPRMADNVGGVARAMANFGLTRLTLSEPKTWHFDERTAVKAEHVMSRAYLARSLDEALSPFAFSCGTTSRHLKRRPALSPRELGEELHRRAAGGADVCVVFGSENHGLTDDDLLRLDAVCRIPTHEDLDRLEAFSSSALLDAGFLHPSQPANVIKELRRMLVRAEPSRREVELLSGAVKQLHRSLVPVRSRSKEPSGGGGGKG